ncbi:MAG: transglutaminase-like domain-containing protein [Oscillospiraceae bacterium]|nr:transglutaminase-like domain-containing protein [Oscillospiraceae bacterium]
MKREVKFIAMIMAVLMIFGTVAGCAATETVELISPTDVEPFDGEEIYIDLAMEMVPLTEAPAMFGTTPMPSAPGTAIKDNSKAVIDYSNSRDGYVMAKYKSTTTKELRVLIAGPSGTQYQYTLKKNATYEVYPLSDGNGKYNIGVYEQVDGSKYAVAVSTQIDVTLSDEYAPFLRPNQYVNFTPESKVVAKAEELIKGKTVLTDKISAIYTFVVTNLTYDKDLAANVKSGYLPDVDAVMAKGKGICFDYAAVMAAMLRSQGVPTRLVVGYAGTAYHAWIDVYSATEGWINAVIFFDGKEWKLMDPTFASSGNQSTAVMQYIGDGTNYTVKYLY